MTGIGSVNGGQIHMAWTKTAKALCQRGIVVDSVTEFAGEGLESTLATLLAADVRPSRLCKHCFAIQTRVKYRQARATSAA